VETSPHVAFNCPKKPSESIGFGQGRRQCRICKKTWYISNNSLFREFPRAGLQQRIRLADKIIVHLVILLASGLTRRRIEDLVGVSPHTIQLVHEWFELHCEAQAFRQRLLQRAAIKFPRLKFAELLIERLWLGSRPTNRRGRFEGDQQAHRLLLQLREMQHEMVSNRPDEEAIQLGGIIGDLIDVILGEQLNPDFDRARRHSRKLPPPLSPELENDILAQLRVTE
jgi:hypothetical protein